MRELAEILHLNGPNTEKVRKYYQFNCEHCDAEYGDFTLHLAIHTYGCVVLTGKNSGVFGITCLSCLKTQLFKAKRKDFKKYVLSVGVEGLGRLEIDWIDGQNAGNRVEHNGEEDAQKNDKCG